MQKSLKLSIILLMQVFSMGNVFANVEEITTMARYKEILASGKPAVVKVFADWCGACKDAKSPFEELSNDPDLSSITFASINADNAELKEVQVDNTVEALPSVLFIDGGVVKHKEVGFTKDNIKEQAQKQLLGAAAQVDATAGVEHKDATPKPETPAPAHHEGGLLETLKNFVVGVFMAIRNVIMGVFNWIKGLFGR